MNGRNEIKQLLKEIEIRLKNNNDDYSDPSIKEIFRMIKKRLELLAPGTIEKKLSCLEAMEVFIVIFPHLPVMVQRSFVEYAFSLWKEKEGLFTESTPLEKPLT